MELAKKINLYLAYPLIALIWIYQKTLSLDHGPLKIFYPYGYCKFYPTCSEYARLTLIQRGLMGLPKIFKRVASCTPSSMGGVDLPEKI